MVKKVVGALSDLAQEKYKQEFDPETFYHGGDIKGEVFDPSAVFRTPDAVSRTPASFFTEEKGYAQVWADRKPSGKIYEVKIKTKDLFNYKNKEHLEENKDLVDERTFFELRVGDPYAMQGAGVDDDVPGILKDLGYRGFFTNETSQLGSRSVGLFYPDEGDVRLVKAAFDPEKSKSGVITASFAGGALSNLERED